MDYTWTITRVGKRDVTNNDGISLSDAITVVKWKKVGTDSDGNQGVYLGTTQLDVKSTTEEDFVTYNSVTTENILTWVQSTISDSEMANIDKVIADQIDHNSNAMVDWPNS